MHRECLASLKAIKTFLITAIELLTHKICFYVHRDGTIFTKAAAAELHCHNAHICILKAHSFIYPGFIHVWVNKTGSVLFIKHMCIHVFTEINYKAQVKVH
jgi:hypothetical protein